MSRAKHFAIELRAADGSVVKTVDRWRDKPIIGMNFADELGRLVIASPANSFTHFTIRRLRK